MNLFPIFSPKLGLKRIEIQSSTCRFYYTNVLNRFRRVITSSQRIVHETVNYWRHSFLFRLKAHSFGKIHGWIAFPPVLFRQPPAVRPRAPESPGVSHETVLVTCCTQDSAGWSAEWALSAFLGLHVNKGMSINQSKSINESHSHLRLDVLFAHFCHLNGSDGRETRSVMSGIYKSMHVTLLVHYSDWESDSTHLEGAC